MRGDFDQDELERRNVDEIGDAVYYAVVCAHENGIELPDEIVPSGTDRPYRQILSKTGKLANQIFNARFEVTLGFYLIFMLGYLSELANRNGSSMNDVMSKNKMKLELRMKAGTIKGDGKR